jgi:hypothetical protein
VAVARHSAGSSALAPVTAVVDLCASLCKLAPRVLLISSLSFAVSALHCTLALLVLVWFPHPPKKVVLDKIFRFSKRFPNFYRNSGT